MPESESDYKVGPGRPPLHTPLKKGQSRQPRRSPSPTSGATPSRSGRS